jgi:CheY-like chemotaxis protein
MLAGTKRTWRPSSMIPELASGKSILVVDDDPANRDSLALLLRVQGYTVNVAGSGHEAFECLRTGPLPDLILLDLLMPGMNGWEFRERQRQDARLNSVPVVVISAVGEVAERQDLLGDVGYLQKALDVDQLTGAIRRFTAERRPSVLIVEDEAGVRTMLDTSLRHYGFTVRMAAGGWEAVELFREHHEAIDVVLLDVQMPGVDGACTLATLQIINPQVRCCFMSGHTGRYSAEELRAMGAWHVVPKPFVSLSLLAQTLWDIVTPPTA